MLSLDYGSPLDDMYREMRTSPRRLPITPEEEQGLLEGVLGQVVGGLQYAGETLDKPGRAVRGLLAGRPDELANLIPFSDAMGLTDPSEAVQGRDLLEQYGLAPENRPGLFNSPEDFMGDMGGFATEVALDPLTYLTLGTGAVAKVAGKALPKGARAALAVKVPFMQDALATVGTHNFPKVMEASDIATKAVLYGDYSPVRHIRSLFDPSVMGFVDRAGQQAAEAVYGAKFEKVAEVRGRGLSLLRKLDDLNKKAGEDYSPALREALEGFNPESGIEELDNLTNELKSMLAERVDRQEALGLSINRLNDSQADYWPRGISVAAKTAFDSSKEASLYNLFHPSHQKRMQVLKNVPGGTESINRMVQDPLLSGIRHTKEGTIAEATKRLMGEYGIESRAHAKDLARYLSKLPGKFSAEKLKLFDRDPVTDMIEYLEHAAGSEAAGEAIHKAIFNAAKDNSGELSVPEAFQAMGMNESALPTFFGENGAALGAKSIDDLEDIRVPQRLVDAASKLKKLHTEPQEVGPLMELWDKVGGMFRRGYTVWFPAFHGRNFLSGTWQNWVSGAYDSPVDGLEAYKTAHNLLFAKQTSLKVGDKTLTAAELLDELKAHRVTDIPEHLRPVSSDSVGVYELGDLGSERAFRTPDRFGQTFGEEVDELGRLRGTAKAISRTGQDLSRNVEWYNRVAGYLGHRMKGLDPSEAARRVREVHFDYGELSNLDQKINKLTMFWTFTRKNMPYTFGQLLQHPGGRMAQTVRAIEEGRSETYLPEWLSQGASIPIGADEESESYLTGFGLPVEEALGRFRFGPGSGKGMAYEALGMLNPMLKGPMEQLAGEQFFSGKQLDELDPQIARILSNLGVTEEGTEVLPQGAEQAIANSPIARALTTLRKFTDTRHGAAVDPLQTALNSLTGLKFTTQDREKLLRSQKFEARQILEELLGAEPDVKDFESLYIKKEDMDKVDPEIRDALELYNHLLKQAKAAGKK